MVKIAYLRVSYFLPVLSAMVFAVILSLQGHALADTRKVDKVKQVGAFHKWENALALSEEIQKGGKKAFIMEKSLKGEVFYAVLESDSTIDQSSKPPTVEELGYIQAGSFLNRNNAEQMILSLRQQGAITFHCMKKIDDKIYYKVYRKTGTVVSSPCTLETSETPRPSVALKPNTSSTPPPPDALPADASPMAAEPNMSPSSGSLSTAPESEHPVTGMLHPEGASGYVPTSPRFIINSTDDSGMTEEGSAEEPGEEIITAADGTQDGMEMADAEPAPEKGRFIVNTAIDGMDATEPDESEGPKEAGTDMAPATMVSAADDTALDAEGAAGVPQAIPRTGPLAKRPPLSEAPQDMVLDMSPIRPIDDNRHFYIKPEAVVFTDRDQFGTWYARFNEFGGGMVTGQSNKWYIVWFREGVTGFVQKSDTVEYVLPYEHEETYR